MKSHFHRALSYIKARKEMIDFFSSSFSCER